MLCGLHIPIKRDSEVVLPKEPEHISSSGGNGLTRQTGTSTHFRRFDDRKFAHFKLIVDRLWPALSTKHGYKSAEEYKESAQNKFSLLDTGIMDTPSTRLLLINVR